jgi:hypothetical protein
VPADPPFDEAAEPDRLRTFVAELEADGFQRVGPREWRGPTPRSLLDGRHTDSDTMTVVFRPSWPYLPPLLDVPGIAAWHADQERLCIWQGEDNSQRWVTLQGLYDRIDEWAAHAEQGFADVENARNPEIYWQERMPVAAGLVDLDELLGPDRADGQHGEFHFFQAVSADGRMSPGVFDLFRGPFTAMTKGPVDAPDTDIVRGRWFYRHTIPHPPRSLEELTALLTEKQRDRLRKDLRDRPMVMFGLVWQNQAGPVATMLLSTRTSDGRKHALVLLRPKGREALLLRAGPDVRLLQTKTIAVIGLGAIGSHVADQFARAGARRLRLLDHDLLWPANLIRHSAPPGTPAGMAKTAALKQQLGQYPWIEIEIPAQPSDGFIWTAPQLRDVLGTADLTIDATGHSGLAELTARIALLMGRPFLSVALYRGGAVARIRRQAYRDDAPLLQRPYLNGYPEITPLSEEVEYVGTETGCLAPVHNAPPVSVAHAASLAVEVAIDFLTGPA